MISKEDANSVEQQERRKCNGYAFFAIGFGVMMIASLATMVIQGTADCAATAAILGAVSVFGCVQWRTFYK